MATANIINMNDQSGMMDNRMDRISQRQPRDRFDSADSQNLVEHSLRPKGRAIPGIDYGLDLMKDDGAGNGTGPGPGTGTGTGTGQDVQAPPRPRPPSMGGGMRSMGDGSAFGPGPSPAMGYQGQGYGAESMGGSSEPMNMPMQDMRHGGAGAGAYGYGGDSVGIGMQMPGFTSVPMDAQSMSGGSVAGAGFVDGNLLGHLPGSGMSMMEPELNYEEKRRRKTDALANLARLESQGYSPAGKKGSHTTELAELEAMVNKLTAQRDLDNSIKYQRKILIGFATMAESVCENDDYNIFELDLEGWSESLYENISEYDEVFEELYLKYKDVAKIPPELKLVTMVAGSAWMYHMSRNMFGKAASKVPGFDEVMKFNPDLKKHYQQSASALAQQRGVPVPDRKKDKSNFNFLGQMFGVNQTPDMVPPPTGPPNRQSANRHPPAARGGPPPRGQGQGQGQGQRQRPLRGNGPPPPPSAGPLRRTRNRVPMEEPQDVDGLLSGLVTQDMGSMGPEEDEIDLSEMENMSDLDQL